MIKAPESEGNKPVNAAVDGSGLNLRNYFFNRETQMTDR